MKGQWAIESYIGEVDERSKLETGAQDKRQDAFDAPLLRAARRGRRRREEGRRESKMHGGSYRGDLRFFLGVPGGKRR